MPLDVRANLGRFESRALTDANRGELARPHERVHAASGDSEDPLEVGDRE
jgi:hypothetical protein